MDLGQLRQAIRDAMDDNSTPPLYADAELDRHCNGAVTEAVLRARLLQDDASALCQLPMVVGKSRYQLDPKILVTRAVHVSGRRDPLARTTSARLDRICPGWAHQESMPGTPVFAVFDVQQKSLTLHPTPAEAGTIYLRVWRLPADDEVMEADDDEPCVILPDPESLKHWALHECYLKKDGELYDPERAATHLALFAERFGPRPSIHDLTLWSTQPITGPRHKQLDY